MNEKTICFILGGGVGSRLYPLTKDRSKPAVPIGGKYRLIDIPLSNCLNSGMRKIYVLTQYNAASLNKHIKNNYNFDVFSNGFVEILAAEQTAGNPNWYQGTADAIRQSMYHLANDPATHIMILSGDQLYQMDYQKMLQQHIDQGAELTIATKPVGAKDATGFGIMKVDEASQVTNFIEKPEADQLPGWRSKVDAKNRRKGWFFLASMGIYIFSKKALQQLFYENPEANDFGKEIIPYAIANGYEVVSHQFDEYWTDIGTIRSFYEANLGLTDMKGEFNFIKNMGIYTQANMLAPAQITGTRFINCIIGEGSIIQAKKIQRSVIGIRSRIGKKTIISRSVIFGNDTIQLQDNWNDQTTLVPAGIGNNCIIENAIIDKNCCIGNNVSIVGDQSLPPEEHEAYSIVDGIIIIKKGALIPDGTTIGLVNKTQYTTEPAELIGDMV